ncbi:MAG: tRNA1(Val) (adenine(37)-N6)-methyltransferase [Christensenellales bacterium]|jgi:tRNA1Val (adenine37-N6)-methyltransferase
MPASQVLLEHERLDDLQNGLKIIQDPSSFCFGSDAVVLSSFCRVKRGAKVCDLGTGNGIIALLLAAHTEAQKIVGIEIQEQAADMARRSVALNGLSDRVEILNMDLKDAADILGRNSFDTVVCNPPYGKAGRSFFHQADARSIARHEILCTLSDCVKTAAALANNGGNVAFVCPGLRVAELFSLFEQHRLSIKRARTVHPAYGAAPSVLLVEGVKGGKSGLAWLPPLFLTDGAGNMTKECKEAYHMEG